MTANVAAYDNLAANWASVMASSYVGEAHMLLDSYTFSHTHAASDIASSSLCITNTKLAFVTSGDFEVEWFFSNPILLNIPGGAGSYRFVVYTMQTSHTPLLWIDLGSSRSIGSGAIVALTLSGNLLEVTT